MEKETRLRNIRFWRIWAKLEKGQQISGGERKYFIDWLKYWLKDHHNKRSREFIEFLIKVAEGKERLIVDDEYRKWKYKAAQETPSGSPIELYDFHGGGRGKLDIHRV